MHEAIGCRIDHRDPVLPKGNNFRMANLIGFAIGKPQFKRLERLPVQPFSNRLDIHSTHPLTMKPLKSHIAHYIMHRNPIHNTTFDKKQHKLLALSKSYRHP